MPRNYAKKKKSHKAAMVMIFLVVAFFCGTLAIANSNKQEELDKDLQEVQRLQELIQEQENRTLELQDLKVYVKTLKYVEEKAKELGLVYPDEILYKPRVP
ncbi:MAG: septum formation initiator [Lachnospiraceae bacterium]|nr:septum formation initiator [Lachnospiraceae bacterium]